MAKKKQKLTPKQKRFVVEYYKNNMDATKAAIAAGYSKDTAGQYGYQLLQKTLIKEAVVSFEKDYEVDSSMQANDILDRLECLASYNIEDFFDNFVNGRALIIKSKEDLSRDLWYCVKQIEETANGIKVTFYDKMKSLELLGKYRKMFSETVDHKSSDGSMTPKFTFIEQKKK